MVARTAVVLDSLMTEVSARSARLVTTDPGNGRDQGEQSGDHRAESDEKDEERNEDPEQLGVGLGPGLVRPDPRS